MDVASDGHRIGRQTETGDLRKETDVDIEPVRARLQQHGVAAIGKVRALLLGEPAVDATLRVGRAGVDDQHVRSKIRILRRLSASRGDRIGTDSRNAGQHAAPRRLSRHPMSFSCRILAWSYASVLRASLATAGHPRFRMVLRVPRS
jgi:hypothetical protein